MFLLYIIKFNTNLGKICFCFSGALGGVTRALGESSTCVSCLYKQMPFVPSWLEVYTNTSDFRTSTSDFCTSTSDFHTSTLDLRRYRPILRPISFVVRYYHSDNTFVHSNIIQFIILYINKFNTSLGRIYFCFSGALGGVIMVLEEFSTCVSCLYKQIPFVPFFGWCL